MEKSGEVFTLKAHLKDLFAWQRTDDYTVTGRRKDLVANLDRIRLSPDLNFSDTLLVHVDFDNELITGNYLHSREFDYLWRTPYRDYNDLAHLTREVRYTDDYLYRMNVLRAYAKLALGDFTVTAGRQQVRFGSGRLWNPLDILNPVSPLSLEGSAEQKGTDALRADYFFNAATELTAVIAQGRTDDGGVDSGRTSGLGRFKTTAGRADIALLGGRVLRRDVAGADVSIIVLSGTLRGAVIRSRGDDSGSFTQAGAGYEYTFGFGLYFLTEYFYNQNGLNYDPALKSAYLSNLFNGPSDANFRKLSGQIVTFNRHYLAQALGYDITPLVRAEIFAAYDFQGRALLVNPTIRYNILQNADLSAGLMKSWGGKRAKNPSDFDYLENYPLVYASFVWYIL